MEIERKRGYGMKTVILYASSHHGNTKKIAQAMAEVLGAELVDLTREQKTDLSACELVGFASGIYYGKVHNAMKNFLERTQFRAGQRAFAVCTCGANNEGYARMMEGLLEEKGLSCAGSFWCRGFDTFGPFKLVGGIAKGRPNGTDLERARGFARGLI